MRIGDLIRRKDDIVLENDVQLDWYPDDPRNRGLVGGYMFTRNAPPGKKSSIQLIEALREAIEHGKPNRFVAIANYGRGKTHFALALANFFGKPADSPEAGLLLRNIEHVADAATAEHFADFKKRRPPFLILRIRGDQMAPLYQQVMRGLEKAVREVTGRTDERLPLWFDKALSFLQRLSPDHVTQAERFLAERHPGSGSDDPLTYEMLCTWVVERRPEAHDPCRELFAHLHGGTYPDFGGMVGIQQALAYTIEHYCKGAEPQAGGILVIFDELSVFVERYAGSHDASLQDLLNGVRDHPHHAACIAFAQHDPNTVVRSILRNPDDPRLQSIEKELDRFERGGRYSLHSTLEMVLDAHFQANDQPAFDRFYDQFIAAFGRASDDTMRLFGQRYVPPDWSRDSFDRIVTRGCFPLHPMTTALFADMEIGEVANARNVLGLLKAELDAIAGEPVEVNNRPNWVFPISMVDWYRDALSSEHYRAYLAASEKAGSDAPQIQKDLLKALLLCAAASRLSSRELAFTALMEHLTGHPRNECAKHLDTLTRASYIQYDDHRKVYRLWPPGADPTRLERELAQEVAKRRLDRQRLDEITRRWESSGRLSPIEVQEVRWGNPSDWACARVLATRETLAPGWLRSLAATYRLDHGQGLKDGIRGVLVQLIAETTDELVTADEAADLLQASLPEDAPPVVLALPAAPSPNVRRLMLEEQVLREWTGKQEHYGADIFRNAIEGRKKDLGEALSSLVKGSAFCVHPDHRASGWASQDTPEHAVRGAYRARYRHAPPAFFQNYKAETGRLPKAVGIVSEALFTGAPQQHKSLIESDPVAKDLYAKFIRCGTSDSWQLVSVCGALVSPQGEKPRKAWDHLDHVFARGGSHVRISEGIMPLLNPPYGYDWNTALLLFAAWFGCNRRELTLERKGLPLKIEDLDKFRDLLKKPRDFWVHVCDVAQLRLSRNDPAKEEDEIRELIRTSRSGTFDLEEAELRIARLRTYADDTSHNADVCRDARFCADELAKDLTKASEYGRARASVLDAIEQRASVKELVGKLGDITGLPGLGRVRAQAWETADKLRGQLVQAIRNRTTDNCGRFCDIKKVEDYGLRRQQLQDMRKHLEAAQDSALTEIVDKAVSTLASRHKELRAQQEDDRLVAQAQAMQPSAPLRSLRTSLVHLQAMVPKSEVAGNTIAAKTSELTEAARAAEEWARGLAGKVAELRTAKDARGLRDTILTRRERYADTPECEMLEAEEANCALIAETLQRLDAMASVHLGSPADLESTTQQIHALREEHEVRLSPCQLERFEEALGDVQRRVDQLREAAMAWLADRERDLGAGTEPQRLLALLEQPHAFLPEAELPRVDRLRTAAEELRDKAEQERQTQERAQRQREEDQKHDRALVDEAKRMRLEGPLAALRSDLARLQEMRPRTEKGINEIAKRRNDFAAAITEAQDAVRTVCKRLPSTDTSDKARRLHRDVDRMLARYDGCPEREDLAGCAERCEIVERFLARIEGIRSAEVRAPADVDLLVSSAEEALADGGDELSETHRATAEAVQQQVRSCADELTANAQRWLADLEALEAKGNDPIALQRKLSDVPAFLPANDAPRLTALQQRVQDRIDADEVASVLDRFSRIRSRARREECLQRLGALMSDQSLP